jgi:glycosyltransferase involved in cell wall biosynthesis
MITFIIPAYGESPYLGDCIASLKNQKVSCRILIATSTPNKYIAEIAEKFNVDYFTNNLRDSIASDWNFALNLVDRGLVVLAHQDDVYFPSYAEEAVKFFSKNIQCAIAFTDSKEIINGVLYGLPKREIIKLAIRKAAFLMADVVKNKFQFFRLFAFGCPIPCSSVIFNLNNLQGLRFCPEYSVNLDWELWVRIAEEGGAIGYIRGSHIAHRIHDGAETQAALKDSRRHNEDKKMFSRFWPKYIALAILFVYRAGYSN